jgi:hypothetical protein
MPPGGNSIRFILIDQRFVDKSSTVDADI